MKILVVVLALIVLLFSAETIVNYFLTSANKKKQIAEGNEKKASIKMDGKTHV